MARWLAEPGLVCPKVYFCGSLRTRSKNSLRLLTGMVGGVLTSSGPIASSVIGVKSLTKS